MRVCFCFFVSVGTHVELFGVETPVAAERSTPFLSMHASFPPGVQGGPQPPRLPPCHASNRRIRSTK